MSTVFTTDNRDEDIERIVEQFDGLQQMRSEVNERTRQRLLKEVYTELKDISKEKHHHPTNRGFRDDPYRGEMVRRRIQDEKKIIGVTCRC